MKETLKKLNTGHVEVKHEVTRTETFTVKPEVLARDVLAAEAVVTQRESELESAKKNLADLEELKKKVDKAK